MITSSFNDCKTFINYSNTLCKKIGNVYGVTKAVGLGLHNLIGIKEFGKFIDINIDRKE